VRQVRSAGAHSVKVKAEVVRQAGGGSEGERKGMARQMVVATSECRAVQVAGSMWYSGRQNRATWSSSALVRCHHARFAGGNANQVSREVFYTRAPCFG